MNVLAPTLSQLNSSWIETREAHPWWLFAAEVALLAIGFAILRPQFRRHAGLKEREYFLPIPLAAFLRHGSKVVFTLVMMVPLILRAGGTGWLDISDTRTLQVFIVAISASLSWTFAAYQFNGYYGQLHLTERLLVLALLALLVFHPLFLPPLLIALFVQRHQFRYPLGSQFGMTDKVPLFEVLILFSGFLIFHALGIPIRSESFAIFAFSIPASSYFYSGIRKLQIGWTQSDRLSNLFAAAYDNGWHRFLSAERMKSFSKVLDLANGPLKIYTMVIELGIVVGLAHEGLAAGLLLALVLLHLGIFISSGICFWEWIVLDLTLIPFLMVSMQTMPDGLGLAPLFFSAVVILLGPLLFTVKFLGWHDSPLSGVYRFDGILSDGTVVEIPPRRFAPYDLPFAQNRFHYLNPGRVLVNVYGKAGSPEIFEGLLAVSAASELEELRERLGNHRRDTKKETRLEKLIRNLLNHRDRFSKARQILRLASPPQHIRTGPISNREWDGVAELTSIRIRYTETLFRDGVQTVLSDCEIRTLDLNGTSEDFSGTASPDLGD